jgi:hypothetical protein
VRSHLSTTWPAANEVCLNLAIFQFGTFIGSVIALAINIRSGKLTAVSTSTYIVRPLSHTIIHAFWSKYV